MKKFFLMAIMLSLSLFLTSCVIDEDEAVLDEDYQSNPVPGLINYDEEDEEDEDEEENIQSSVFNQASVVKRVTCSKGDESIVFVLKGQAGPYVCILDDLNTAKPDDWNARFTRDYCSKELDSQVISKTANGWTCS